MISCDRPGCTKRTIKTLFILILIYRFIFKKWILKGIFRQILVIIYFKACDEHQNQRLHSLQPSELSEPFLRSWFSISTVLLHHPTLLTFRSLSLPCFTWSVLGATILFLPSFVHAVHNVIAFLIYTSKGDRCVSLPSSHLNLSLLQVLFGRTSLLTAFFHNFLLLCDNNFKYPLPDLAKFYRTTLCLWFWGAEPGQWSSEQKHHTIHHAILFLCRSDVVTSSSLFSLVNSNSSITQAW